MEGHYIIEVALGHLSKGDLAVCGQNDHGNTIAMESCHRILQANPKLANDFPGILELLGVFVLREVLVSEPASEIADSPVAIIGLEDLDVCGIGQLLFVDRIGDEFADRMRALPRFENLLDVQIEQPRCGHVCPCFFLVLSSQ